MATNRLTLFDVIADLIPGIVYIVFLIPFMPEQTGAGLEFTIFGTAIVVLALGYALGRIIHALASRALVKKLLERIAWNVGLSRFLHPLVGSMRLRNIRGVGPSEGKAQWGDFDFQTRVDAYLSEQNSDSHDDSAGFPAYEHNIIEKLLERARAEIDYVKEPAAEDPSNLKWEPDAKYLEHVGHSLLHGESTLYHQYTILATFYRNLWVAIVVGILSSMILFGIRSGGSVDAVNSRLAAMLGILTLFVLVLLTLLSVRWLEFRYRRLRAFVNDLYLALQPS